MLYEVITIGSLYASGYTGKELDSVFRGIDFDILISDNLPRTSKAFYERNNSERVITSYSIHYTKLYELFRL